MAREAASGDGDADPLAIARHVALTKLANRAHSVAELRVALTKKNVPNDVIEQVLTRFTAVGLLDDAGFAEQWVASRHEYRHSSRSVLRRELKAKGVDDDQIEAALRPIDADAELAAAELVAAKRVRAMRGLEPHVARRRLAGALARRGFSPGVVADVVRRSVGASEDWGEAAGDVVAD